MFEQVKPILEQKYNSEMTKFEELKQQIEEYEDKFKNDTSEKDYQENLKFLNKSYGLFKKGSKEYKEELNNLMLEYNQKLEQFNTDYNDYIELKNQAAKINVYVIQKKLEQLMNANSLEDLKMSEEEATRILSEGV